MISWPVQTWSFPRLTHSSRAPAGVHGLHTQRWVAGGKVRVQADSVLGSGQTASKPDAQPGLECGEDAPTQRSPTGCTGRQGIYKERGQGVSPSTLEQDWGLLLTREEGEGLIQASGLKISEGRALWKDLDH